MRRFCPQCDAEMTERVCPNDGTATLVVDAPQANLDVLKPGYILNHRYLLERELGRGGFGAVYAAKHTGTGQSVAVKVLFSAGDRNSLRRFFREARVTAQLKSKHTIRVYDFGQDDLGMAYLAMELLHGQPLIDDLKDRLRGGSAFSESEAIDVAVAVCKSLHEAHAAGLVHRDLKPHNVFCADTEDGVVYKVLDFGIAKTADQSLTGGSIMGTVAYMSPEQAQSFKLDGRSDLYSLGAMLFQLVAGDVPFAGETPIQTLMMHMNADPPPVASKALVPVSERFAAAVDRLLLKEPEDRFANAAETIAALDPLRALASHTSRIKNAAVVPSSADLHVHSSVQDETVGAAGAGATSRYKGTSAPAGKSARHMLSVASQIDATAGMPATLVAEAAGGANVLTPIAGPQDAGKNPSLKWIGIAIVAGLAIFAAVLLATHGKDAAAPVPAPASVAAPVPAPAPAPVAAPAAFAAPAAAPAPVPVPAPAPLPAAAVPPPPPAVAPPTETATPPPVIAPPPMAPAAANDQIPKVAKPAAPKHKSDGKPKAKGMDREL